MQPIEAVLFLTDGFEEIEALAVLDILRRGNVCAVSVSLTGGEYVTGSHGITVKADMLFDGLDASVNYQMMVLPGGPGTENYKKNNSLLELLLSHWQKGGRLAAICAAPAVLGQLKILNGKTAACHPSKESELECGLISKADVVTDGNVTTSRGAGTAIAFGLELVRLLKGNEKARDAARAMVYK
ncbi:MAG: DJ-1/PfpI family protein [Defluviitaleaceae bacterium]|nr:DJ-1/PfpI family protein [Defluviitaleaceae bacterium]